MARLRLAGRNAKRQREGKDSPYVGNSPAVSESRTAAGPVLELKSGNTFEVAFIVGDESEPRGFGVSSNPETGHARCRAGHPDALNAARKQIRAPNRGPERAVQHSRQ
jgi:hypothetical protein